MGGPLFWVMLAGLVGFAAAAIFSTWLHWHRNAFVLAYAGVTGAFFTSYVRTFRVRVMAPLRRRWLTGSVIGLVAGALLAYGVSRQPASSHPAGTALVASLVWLGLVYGSLDALLLTVLPVLSVYGSRPPELLTRAAPRVRWALLALLASLGVTAAYHLGFAEFRSPALLQPLIGNAIVTLAYLLAGTPVAPVLAHVIMHGAAVLHGMSTTVQLPPHY
jgi:hypothetical protein